MPAVGPGLVSAGQGHRVEVTWEDERAAPRVAVAEFGDAPDAGDGERVGRECSDFDIVVANAALPGALEEYTVEQVDRVLDVNLRAPVVLARVIGERMLARGSGHLVFVSSLSGKAASLYNATKFGVRGFALALRNDWRAPLVML